MVQRKQREYTDEFKLEVIKEYLNGPLGCRTLAKKYNLPSKNYIHNWKEQLIKKGLLDNSNVKKKITKSTPNIKISKTEYEKQLERENFELRAELAYFKELKKLIDEDSKKKELY